MLGVVSTAKDEPPGTAEDAAAGNSEAAGEATSAVLAKGRVNGLFSAAIGLLVRLLDILDRPFARLSDGLKELIGWIALATLGTALVVYLVRVI